MSFITLVKKISGLKIVEVSQKSNPKLLAHYIERYFEIKKVRFDSQYLSQGSVFIIQNSDNQAVAGVTVIQQGPRRVYRAIDLKVRHDLGVAEDDLGEVTGAWIDRNYFPSKIERSAVWSLLLARILSTGFHHFMFCVDGSVPGLVGIYTTGKPTSLGKIDLYSQHTEAFYASRERLVAMYASESMRRLIKKLRPDSWISSAVTAKQKA